MYHYTWYQWLAFFYTYCFFGWIFESAYVSVKTGHFVNRGFLRVPLLPLYGSGAVIMLFLSLPVRDNLLYVYIFGVIGATALEYVTGYVMERLFRVRYWDYSNQRFQLHSYICLTSSITWGFLTILLTEVIHRPVSALYLEMRPSVVIFCVTAVSAVFLCDAFQSVKEALALSKALESLTRLRQEIDEIQEKLSYLRQETVTRVTEVRLETAAKMAALREESEQKLQNLLEKRKSLFSHPGFYRKGLLKGNPTAASRYFRDALKEMKDMIQKNEK